MESLKDVIDKIIKNEGGYFNLYYADGLQTRAGIAWKWNVDFYNKHGIYSPDNIDQLSNEAVEEFYYDYAMKVRCDLLGNHWGLVYSHLDHCINDGPLDGIKVLQSSINLLKDRDEVLLSCDGIIGPKTIKALDEFLYRTDGWKILCLHKGCRCLRYYVKFEQKMRSASKQHAYDCLVSWNRRVQK